MRSLEDDILASLSSDSDIQFDDLHFRVNSNRAEQSILRVLRLGWLRGVSRRSLQEALDNLIASGAIKQDTRNAVVRTLMGPSLEMADHYRKLPSDQDKQTY